MEKMTPNILVSSIDLLPIVKFDTIHVIQRERALEVLCLHREKSPGIGQLLWNGEGIVTVLLQEVISVYPRLSIETGITRKEYNRVCNSVALLRTIAIDPVTQEAILRSHILLYLYPLLDTRHKSHSHEYLRLCSLGLLGSLIRTDTPTIVHFLITSEFIPICLTALEYGDEMSMTVATFIVQKVLETFEGLSYMTNGKERSSAILESLAKVVDEVIRHSSVRLLKPLLRCYIRIVDNNSTRDILQKNFPRAFMDRTFEELVKVDPTVFRLLERFLMKVDIPSPFRLNSSSPTSVRTNAAPSFASNSSKSELNDVGYDDCPQDPKSVYSFFNEME